MANPTKYTRLYDYSAATLVDLRSNLNPEFSDIQAKYSDLVDAVIDIRRSDGALQNEIVTEDSLHPDLVAKLVFEADVWTVDDFTQADVDNWNTAFGWGNHATQGYVVFDDGLQVDTGGNARGNDAVDFQENRTAPSQVASGPASFIGAGINNTASGNFAATLGGQGTIASGNYSVALGSGSVASGAWSFAVGANAQAAGGNSAAIGPNTAVASAASNGVAVGLAAAVNHAGSVVIADGAAGTKASSAANELSLYFANGARLNGNALLDASDLLSNGGTILDSAGLATVATSGDHADLSNIGTNSHADIDTHIADDTKHRTINDSGTAVTDLWSAQKINREIQACYGQWFLGSDITLVSGGSSTQPFDASNEVTSEGIMTDSTGFLVVGRAPILMTGTVEVDNMDASGVLRVEEIDPGVSTTTRFEIPLPTSGAKTFSHLMLTASEGNYVRVVVAKVSGDGTIKENSHMSLARTPGT